MSDRVKKDIEEKKAKLAELRRAREERKAILAQADKAQVEVRSAFLRELLSSLPSHSAPLVEM